MQYYFHIRDGVTLLDDDGHDCADLASVRTQQSQLRVPC
jgi:hypothetical protein